ncbi:ATP-dependent RNA helicase DHX33 [Trichechus manatus latirostris]|uniref:RNA helicase n=1 Tax=Trichechus manatus latirostris TaxID=127582 RepID=A0A2Y9R5A7_TRIMA|nr:ATP-dependent RNA helicase DHX33 [Trichechus manatus latirostris]
MLGVVVPFLKAGGGREVICGRREPPARGGETGSGKTTQIPQYLYEGGISRQGVIAVTQPRRVAAISLATRVSDEKRTELGKLVGYTVRFDDVTSEDTRIKFLTDGMLLREAISDSLLRKYSCVILDEAHERTIHTDVLFGVVKTAQRRRKGLGKLPLKVIVMSATMDVDLFSQYFNGAPVLYLEGRQHPIQVFYTKQPQNDYLHAALVSVFQIHQVWAGAQISGKFCVSLQFTLTGYRKVIISTNIAETSITITGIKYVVDTGMVKAKKYNPVSTCTCLLVCMGRISLGPSPGSGLLGLGVAGSELCGLAMWLASVANTVYTPQSKDWCKENFVNSKNMMLVAEVRAQLRDICLKMSMPVMSSRGDTESIRRCLAHSLFMSTAELQPDGTYATTDTHQPVAIHPSSVLFHCKPACVVYTELLYTNKCYMRDLCVVDAEWLYEAAPEYFRRKLRTARS